MYGIKIEYFYKKFESYCIFKYEDDPLNLYFSQIIKIDVNPWQMVPSMSL